MGDSAAYAPFATTITMYKCDTCGMMFADNGYARRHVQLAKCAGATVVKRRCGVTELPDDYPRKRQAPASHVSTVIHGNHNSVVNVGAVHIILGKEHGDVVRADSAQESELIRKTILENAELRRMVRTIENAPSAIFHLTKGVSGPQTLRNVRVEGRRACELHEQGLQTSGLIEYCKRTAVKMVGELRRAVDSVTPTSPQSVREWARDVRAAMDAKLGGDVDYVTALKLYCEASSRFYRLPKASREAIACGVRNIEHFIADSALF